MKVYKYPLLKVAGVQILECPAGSMILKIGVQHQKHDSQICAWVLVNPSTSEKARAAIQIVGTGHDVPENSTYIDSIIDGPWVWHIFKVKNPEEEKK